MFQRVHLPRRSPDELPWKQFISEPPAPVAEAPFEFADVQRTLIESTPLVAPHATMHPDLPKLFDTYWKSVPDDWDVVTLGAGFGSPPIHVGGHVFRPSELSLIHGIVVRGRGLAELRKANPYARIEDALNAFVRTGSLNVYSLWPSLIVPASEGFNSFGRLGHHGRMGNQFFQVAATIGAAVRYGYRPQFPVWKNSEILAEHFDQGLDLRRIVATYNEPHFHYAPIPSTPELDLFGVFQSPRYFTGYENLIRMYLRPSNRLSDAINSRFSELLSKPTVALHVRRADYVGLAHAFVPLPVEYYRAAMRHFPSDSHFVVFSDDPAWCRTAFKDAGVEVMSGNPGYADLYLMASCRHQIIANSSFSWWAAFLNPNPDKRVIAPRAWFGPALSRNDPRDLLPSEWVTI